MSAINSTLVLTGQQIVNNQQTGSSWEIEYAGTRASILALAASYTAAGVNVRSDLSKPVCTLVASFPYDPTQPASSEVPIDRYELVRDMVSVSIFAAPNVAAEADRYGSAQYRKLIEDAVEAGEDDLNASYPEYPLIVPVFKALCRGIESYETERPVLSRTRTFSANYATRSRIEARPTVYTTATLVSTFSLPAVVAAQLPADPPPADTPAGTVWAWKSSTDTATITPSNNRIEEHKSWTFAAWSTLLYSAV